MPDQTTRLLSIRDARALHEEHMRELWNLAVNTGASGHPEAARFATLEWVDWCNKRRQLKPIGDLLPIEFERTYYLSQERPAMGVGLI